MPRCSKEAFARCPTRHLCGTRDEATFAEGSDCDKFNQAVEHQPMTNADRIRAMSDEELADYINNHDVCNTRTNEECKISYCAVCQVCVLDWLQQSAEQSVVAHEEDKQHSGLVEED